MTPVDSTSVVMPAPDVSRGQAGAPSNQLPGVTPTALCATEAGADVRDAAQAMMNTAGSAAPGMRDAQTMMSARDSGAPGMPDAQVVQTSATSSVLHIYSDAQGNSHLEELKLTVALSKNLPVSSVSISQIPGGTIAAAHIAPARQFAIAIAGSLEVEVSGGARHAVATGQLVFLEDTQGQGHITRVQGAVTNMFIAVPDNFDVTAWASSPF